MGVSPLKVPNINIDTVLNKPQKNSNIPPSINSHFHTSYDESNQHACKKPNKKTKY